MSFKIRKDVGKIGEFIHVDFSNPEPLYGEDVSIDKPGIYKFTDGELILTDGNNVYVYKEKI